MSETAEQGRIWLNKYPDGLKFDINVPDVTFGNYIDDICEKYSNQIAYAYN